MRFSVLFVLMSLFVVAPMFAQTTDAASDSKAVPGQLMGMEVTGGYHLPTAIVLKGNVNIAANHTAKGCHVFINDFYTRVNLEGRWALSFPKRSLYPDKKGTIVKVRVYQAVTNVTIEKEFDLATLNQVMENKLRFDELYK